MSDQPSAILHHAGYRPHRPARSLRQRRSVLARHPENRPASHCRSRLRLFAGAGARRHLSADRRPPLRRVQTTD
ncbi:hypothetical protein E4P32_20920 [Herbaspirillum sp. 3R11]|nr:hypothetical protein DZB54_16250 [Herbaspirillum sp. 3R-3a1]TFI05810.1 hypothetical protein E4P32_20920 [Herbaspirillum sp. 3R11]TFI13671.1 hypothetical protein E4P31_17675 [Herbaspirillum sp. 3R-11]TFI22131.1 hypothetical protein E4P30_19550 [Herbaspirillum sp. 3C11]